MMKIITDTRRTHSIYLFLLISKPQRMSSQTEGDPVTSYSILLNQPINIMSYTIVLGIFLLSSENNDK